MACEKDNTASVSLSPGWWDFVTECLQEKIDYINKLKQGDIDDDCYADFKNDDSIYKIILKKIQESVSSKMKEIEREANISQKVE